VGILLLSVRKEESGAEGKTEKAVQSHLFTHQHSISPDLTLTTDNTVWMLYLELINNHDLHLLYECCQDLRTTSSSMIEHTPDCAPVSTQWTVSQRVQRKVQRRVCL
jgi:hypothetical protein